MTMKYERPFFVSIGSRHIIKINLARHIPHASLPSETHTLNAFTMTS